MNERSPGRSRRRNNRNRSSASNNRRDSMWRPVTPPGPTPRIEPIAATNLIGSLDALPLRGENAQHYVAAVIERAAGLALAVAASAELLEDEPT